MTKYELIKDSIINKIKLVLDGKLTIDSFSSNELEKAQFNLILSLINIESYLIDNPSFEIMEEESIQLVLNLMDNEPVEEVLCNLVGEIT